MLLINNIQVLIINKLVLVTCKSELTRKSISSHSHSTVDVTFKVTRI
jgi:hypothetical protein